MRTRRGERSVWIRYGSDRYDGRSRRASVQQRRVTEKL